MPLSQKQYDAFVRNTKNDILGKCPSCGEVISVHNGNLYLVKLPYLDCKDGYPAIAQVCESCYNIRLLKDTLVDNL